jgi:pilus assembly protein CpaE
MRHPGRVLLIDASLQMGVCANMLDLKPQTTLTDVVREKDRLDETLIQQLATPHPCGLHLLAAPSTAVEAAEIDDETMSRVLTLARRAYSHVLVDTFPMIDRVMMAVLDHCDRAYLVLESTVPTVLGITRLLPLLETLGVPRDRLQIILNRYTGRSDNLKPSDVAVRLGRPIDYLLPYDRKVGIASNLGRPFILDATRWWGFGKAMQRLIHDVERVAPRTSVRIKPNEPSPNGQAEVHRHV